MTLKNKLKNIFYASLLLTTTASCSDWLDVKMEDSVMENTLFSTNEGYQEALNGIYMTMNNVYQEDLSVGIIDILAQYYYVTANYDHTYKVFAAYNFDDGLFEDYRDRVWRKTYELIANVNVLLEHCDSDDAAVSAEYYPIVKGEALALRAMFHFDMLRLYGPVYNESNASLKCIPYQLSSSKEIQPLLPANEVLQHVIDDLEEASKLLVEADPIITDGVRITVENDNGISGSNLNYRQFRLNYYATQVLLARAYAWRGDKTKAYEIAKNNILDKISTEELVVFPWTNSDAFFMEGKPDQVFSSEVFFSLYSIRRSNIYTKYFSSALNARTARLTFVGENLTQSKLASFYDDPNDWRLSMWDVTTGGNEDENAGNEEGGEEGGEEAKATSLYLTKYEGIKDGTETNGTEYFRYMTPLIRLSEVYLIAAEGAPSRDEAIGYINELRTHRSCKNLVDDATLDIQDMITKEFAREVIGEGQLFFYYKRHAMENIISGTSVNGTYGMVLSNYVLPLPKSEVDKRTDYNK